MAGNNPIGNMIVKISLDSAGFNSSMTGLKRQLKSVNTEMRATLSQFDRSEKSVDKYTKHIDLLTKRHEVQGKAVEQAKKEYDEMVQAHGEGSAMAEKYAIKLNEQIALYEETGREIGNLKKELAEFERQQAIQNSGWTKASNALNSFGDKLGQVSKIARDVGSKLTKYITAPILGIGTAIAGITLKFGWERLIDTDVANAKLKGMGYSMKEIGRIQDDVTDAIDGGMTTYAEGVDIAAGAMGAGVKEGKELQRYIKLVGDTAVASGRPVDEMAQIFNRVQGGGKLARMEFDQIQHSMPAFSGAMSEHLGVTQDVMLDMISAGEVSAKDFLDVIEDTSGGMAEAYAKTFPGMAQNIKAYVGIIGESFLGGIFDDVKESMAEFIELLNTDEVRDKAAELGEKVRDALLKIKGAVMGVVDWYRDLNEGQQQLILKLGAFVVALGPLLIGLGTMGGVLAKVSKGLASLFGWLAPIMTPIKGVATGALQGGRAFTILRTALGLLTGPVGIVIGVVTALVGVIVTAYKKSDTFREAVGKLVGTFVEFGQSIWEQIQPAFGAVKEFFGEIQEKISEFINNEGTQITEAFNNIWNVVGTVLGWLTDYVRKSFEDMMAVIDFIMPFIKDQIQHTWQSIKDIISITLDIIMSAIKVFSALFTGDWSKMWEGIKEYGSAVIKLIWTIIRDSFIGRIITAVFEFSKKFVNKISELWTKVKNTFMAKIRETYHNFKDSFVGKLILKLISFSKDFRSNISKMWQKVKDKFTEKILEVYNKVKNSFIGRIILKIIAFSKDFRNNISTMWNKVKNKFTTFIDSIRKSIANSFVGRMLSSVRNLKTKFIDLAGDMWQGVKKQFNNIVDGAKKLPKRIGDGIKNAKSKATDGMKAVGNKLIEWAGKPYNKVIGGVNWITDKLGIKKDIKKWDWKAKQYAKGTGLGGHRGGHAILGDGVGSNAGSELVQLPSGQQFMSASTPTLYPNLPKGTEVLSATNTRDYLSSIPMYAKGTNWFNKAWEGIKGAGSKAKDAITGIWDYATKPKKLLDKLLKGVNLYQDKARVPRDIVKGGFNTVKDVAVDAVKGFFTEAESFGGEGGKPNFPYPITSRFGRRWGRNHNGVDFGFPHGSTVKSQTGGKVKQAGWYGGYGKAVTVKDGIMDIIYAHLSKISRKVGDNVRQGTKIGLSGNTGNSTGPHLHYEVRKNGVPVDPMKLSNNEGVNKYRGVASKALRMTGQYSKKNLDALMNQMRTESNGNPNAINRWDSNAKRGTPSKGLMQVIDPTFNAHKMKGYNDIFAPLDNILASIRYSVSRYGSLTKAYRGVGYKQGTNFVPEDQFALLHKGEAVIPREFNPSASPNATKTSSTKLLALTGKLLSGKGGIIGGGNNDDLLEATLEQNELLRQILANSKHEINQTNHYHNTGELSPSETARKNKIMLRNLATDWG